MALGEDGQGHSGTSQARAGLSAPAPSEGRAAQLIANRLSPVGIYGFDFVWTCRPHPRMESNNGCTSGKGSEDGKDRATVEAG